MYEEINGASIVLDAHAYNSSGVINCQRCSEVNRSNLLRAMFVRGTSGEFVLISEYRLGSRTIEAIHCLAVVLLSDYVTILILRCLVSPAESTLNSVRGPEIFALDVARQLSKRDYSNERKPSGYRAARATSR